jgi:hypothetical protein
MDEPVQNRNDGLDVSLTASFRQRLAREGHIVLGDLTSDLLFPKLTRAVGLALRPERVVFGLALVVAVAFVAALTSIVSGRAWPNAAVYQTIGSALPALGGDLASGRVRLAGQGIGLIVSELGRLFAVQPVSTGLALLGASVVWGGFGAAICRGVACEFAAGVHVGARAAVGFGVRRVLSSAGAVVLAPVAVLLLLGLVGLAGFGSLAFPGVDLVGAVLFGPALVVGVVAVLVGLGFVLAFVMLVPAVAAQDDDAFDALQRSLGYAVARPATLAVYLALALVQGVVATAIVWWIGSLAVDVVGGAIVFFGGRSEQVVTEALDATAGARGGASAIVATWAALPAALALAFFVSYVHTAGTVIYFLMRRLVDGQDLEEVWLNLD